MDLYWLSGAKRKLYEMTRNKSTWGFVVYRTTYTPESNQSFPKVIDRVNALIKDALYSEFASESSDKSHSPAGVAHCDEIWAQYHPVIMDDASKFKGASIDTIRAHFQYSISGKGRWNNATSHQVCIVIDEESLKNFAYELSPEKIRNEKTLDFTSFVKLVKPLPAMKLDTDGYDSSEEYDGFMGGYLVSPNPTLRGKTCDITRLSAPVKPSKWVVDDIDSDDEFDSFMGG